MERVAFRKLSLALIFIVTSCLAAGAPPRATASDVETTVDCGKYFTPIKVIRGFNVLSKRCPDDPYATYRFVFESSATVVPGCTAFVFGCIKDPERALTNRVRNAITNEWNWAPKAFPARLQCFNVREGCIVKAERRDSGPIFLSTANVRLRWLIDSCPGLDMRGCEYVLNVVVSVQIHTGE